MAYELIETVEVGSGGASSIEFTSIPQDGTDLVLVLSGRSTSSGQSARIEFNNDTTETNYNRLNLTGNGSAASSSSGNNSVFSYINPSTHTANTFAVSNFYISNYTVSQSKSISIETAQENNATSAFMGISANNWVDTSAIISIKLTPSVGDFAENSTASLYKITAA